MAFCKYCGKQLREGEQCTCAEEAAAANNRIFAEGTAAPPAPVYQPQAQPVQPDMQQNSTALAAGNRKKKTGIIIAAAAVLLAVIGVLVWFLFLRGDDGSDMPDYEKPVSQLFKGINQQDSSICIDAMATDRAYRILADEEYDGDISKSREQVQRACEEVSDLMKDFFEEASDEWDAERISYSYRISGKERLEDYELREIEEECDSLYESRGLSSGYRLNVKVTVKADDRSETASGYFTVVKTDDGWRLVPKSNEDFKFSRLHEAEDMIELGMES